MSRRPVLSGGQVAALAVELFNSEQVTISPVATPGMETQAFQITNGSRTGCLRIGSHIGGFRKDAWARNVFGQDLPVPEVWEIGELPDGSAFCLTSWAPGRTLQDLPPDETHRITPLVFEAWSQLQVDAITATSGFGDLDPDTMTAPYLSHQDHLRAALTAARRWPSTWINARRSAVSTLLDRYESLIDACPDERAFVHGDWGCNNILAVDDHLTAILDWESISLGDPLQDIAGRFWAFWPPVSNCVSALASYADQRLGQLPNYRARTLCYDLRTGISEITESLAEQDSQFADRCLSRCLALLDAYDRSPR